MKIVFTLEVPDGTQIHVASVPSGGPVENTGNPQELAPIPNTYPQPQPAFAPQPAQQAPRCPMHNQSTFVPGGISKRTQKPYKGFYKCPQCEWKADA